jgi:hypothetical protein
VRAAGGFVHNCSRRIILKWVVEQRDVRAWVLNTRAVQKVSSDGLLKNIHMYVTKHVYCHLMYTPYATFRHNFHQC